MMQPKEIDRFIIYGFPGCPYCIASEKLLDEAGHKYFFISFTRESRMLNEIKQAYKRKTVPIIFAKQIGDEDLFIGGYSDLETFLKSK